MGDWNIPYPVPNDESLFHPTVIKSRSDHQLATTVMKVLDHQSSATAEVTAPRSASTEFQRTDSKSKILQLGRVREELSSVQGCRIKVIADDSVPDDVKVKIDQIEVNARNGIEFKLYAGDSSVVNGSVSKFCDVINSSGGTMLDRSYTDIKSAFSRVSQHKTAKNQKPKATFENRTLGLVNSKIMRHGLHSSDSRHDTKVKLESPTGFMLVVDNRLQILCASENVWHHLGYQQVRQIISLFTLLLQ